MKIKQNVFLDVQDLQIDLLPKFKGICKMLLIRNSFHKTHYILDIGIKKIMVYCTKSAHRLPHNK